MIRLPTFSAIERAAACVGSVALPAVGETTVYAEKGQGKHDYLEAVARDGLATALTNAPAEMRTWAESLDYDALPLMPGTFAAEVAFALDVFGGTAREIGRGIGRNYGELGPTEIAGTVDLVGLAADGETVIVIDWKTGSQRVAPAAKNWQMRAGAVAAARAYGRSRAVVQVVYLGEDGSRYVDTATFDSWDMESSFQDLATLVALWHGQGERERLKLARGGHCRYCPSFDACPAQHELLQIAVRKPDQLANRAEEALTRGDRGEAFRIWEELKLLTKRIGERITAHAAVRPIELGEGRYYGFCPGDRRAKDPAKVKEILAAHLGVEAAAAAVKEETKSSTTIGAIEKALKALPPKQRPGVWAELLAAGAVAQPPSLGEYEQPAAATEAA